jgi:hypothetical protein
MAGFPQNSFATPTRKALVSLERIAIAKRRVQSILDREPRTKDR